MHGDRKSEISRFIQIQSERACSTAILWQRQMSEMKSVSQPTTIGKKLAPFNPAGNEVVDISIELLQVKSGDVLYDLGCGDARLLAKVF